MGFRRLPSEFEVFSVLRAINTTRQAGKDPTAAPFNRGYGFKVKTLRMTSHAHGKDHL